MKILNNAASLIREPNNWIYAIFVGVLIAFCTGALAQSGNVYYSGQVASPVLKGKILQAREVAVQAQDSTRYAGAAAGAALGGGLGAWAGRHSRGASTVLGLVGASLGGVAGNSAAQHWGVIRSPSTSSKRRRSNTARPRAWRSRSRCPARSCWPAILST
jgi:outer membrane lipoprotein SlyB